MKRYLAYFLLTAGISVVFVACNGSATNISGADKIKDDGFFSSSGSTLEETASLELSPMEYVTWCEDKENGLIADKQIGNFMFSAFYKPSAYQVLKESADPNALKKPEFDKSVKEYGDMQYFSFRITDTKGNQELLRVNLNNESEYYSRIEYLSFKMQNDFKLIEGTDTLACSLYHYERVYSLAPYATFVLGFPKGKGSDEDKKIVYEDKLFNSGIIYLGIKKDVLTHLPKLKF